ncbi:MAG: hypothetical protein CXZ00_12490 [Acidobacteria bacterium]|nr:MAG: hypothetical protein CXZ00_12490 [Acidobacteriota bacterium]
MKWMYSVIPQVILLYSRFTIWPPKFRRDLSVPFIMRIATSSKENLLRSGLCGRYQLTFGIKLKFHGSRTLNETGFLLKLQKKKDRARRPGSERKNYLVPHLL